MPNNNKQATKAKYSNLSQKIYTCIIGTLVAVTLPLLIADAESTAILLLTKVAGIGLFVLSQYLFSKLNHDPNEYADEYIR